MKPPQPSIAVVMAVYNGAATVARAIDSVLAQQFDGLRLVIVDDGSTDATPRIVGRYAEANPEIISLRLPANQGKAAALTAGFKAVQPLYFICCDADDIFAPGAFSTLFSIARQTGADIVTGAMREIRGRRTRLVTPARSIASLNDMPLDTVHFSLCNKLIRASILTDCAMPFVGIDRWEDLGVVARAVVRSQRMEFVGEPVYDYWLPPGVESLSRSSKPLLLADRIAMTARLSEWFLEQGLAGDYAGFLDHLKFSAKVRYARAPGRDLRKWASVYPEINRRILRLRHIPLAYRLLFYFVGLLFSPRPASRR